jgi:hypothetical protein
MEEGDDNEEDNDEDEDDEDDDGDDESSEDHEEPKPQPRTRTTPTKRPSYSHSYRYQPGLGRRNLPKAPSKGVNPFFARSPHQQLVRQVRLGRLGGVVLLGIANREVLSLS